MSLLQKTKEFFAKPEDPIELLTKQITDLNNKQVLDAHIGSMLMGVLEIREMRASELMVPRAHIDYFDAEDKLVDVIDKVLEYGHSRYPILSEDQQSIGLLFSKDLLRVIHDGNYENLTLADIAKPIRIIPEAKRVTSLLKEFQQTHTHLALVVNETGEISGLITIEDILEEIVGEIMDEFDKEEIDIKPISKTSFEVLGSTSIEDFNSFFKVELNDEEFDTISGYIINELQRVPVKNELFNLADDKLAVRVVQLNDRQIIKLRIRANDPTLTSTFGYPDELIPSFEEHGEVVTADGETIFTPDHETPVHLADETIDASINDIDPTSAIEAEGGEAGESNETSEARESSVASNNPEASSNPETRNDPEVSESEASLSSAPKESKSATSETQSQVTRETSSTSEISPTSVTSNSPISQTSQTSHQASAKNFPSKSFTKQQEALSAELAADKNAEHIHVNVVVHSDKDQQAEKLHQDLADLSKTTSAKPTPQTSSQSSAQYSSQSTTQASSQPSSEAKK